MPDIPDAECVHILFGCDCRDDRFFVQALGQGELAEDAVNAVPVIQFINQREQFVHCRACGEGVFLGKNARFGTGFLFVVLPQFDGK